MNAKSTKLNLVAIVLGAFVAVCCQIARAETHTVIIDGGAYSPPELAINVGDTVNWFAVEGDHTVTSDTGVFDSGEIFMEETFTHTFTAVGQFGYHCTVHGSPGSGMFGTVFVNEGAENQPPETPSNLLPVNGATNQPLTAQLAASPFSDPDPLDFHAASQWIIRRASDNQIVFDSGTDTVNKTNLTVPVGVLAEGSNYNWQVRYEDGRDAWSGYSAPTTFRTLVAVTANGTGLKASYYNSVAFTSPLTIETNGPVSFNWGVARPNRRVTADTFGVRWEGSILPQYTETYRVQLQFRGRARVWVNDQLIINEWEGCAFPQSRWGTVSLVGGQLASIRIDYGADATGAQAVLRWASPSRSAEVIPTNRLFPTAP
ncbi:MAG TPA: PA14 domain-containing protein [Verrucomicrobiota bacterium]|nr:PA14 domain-containing protein [Verrucomicrobiota bacterium]